MVWRLLISSNHPIYIYSHIYREKNIIEISVTSPHTTICINPPSLNPRYTQTTTTPRKSKNTCILNQHRTYSLNTKPHTTLKCEPRYRYIEPQTKPICFYTSGSN